tara:strand:- start:106 stop:507 length:402 start_codon:yes stop_codon:yes gene_type:complete
MKSLIIISSVIAFSFTQVNAEPAIESAPLEGDHKKLYEIRQSIEKQIKAIFTKAQKSPEIKALQSTHSKFEGNCTEHSASRPDAEICQKELIHQGELILTLSQKLREAEKKIEKIVQDGLTKIKALKLTKAAG